MYACTALDFRTSQTLLRTHLGHMHPLKHPSADDPDLRSLDLLVVALAPTSILSPQRVLCDTYSP